MRFDAAFSKMQNNPSMEPQMICKTQLRAMTVQCKRSWTRHMLVCCQGIGDQSLLSILLTTIIKKLPHVIRRTALSLQARPARDVLQALTTHG
jgi:hypothetical protein